MKKNFLLVLTALFLTSIIGCNMIKGAGKDVENTGRNVQETVDKND
jgi:predicted small secreted protein